MPAPADAPTGARASRTPTVSMKDLLQGGVHFGHQTRRWNPKMKPYIFAERGGIYIIDLLKTSDLIDEAYDFVRTTVGRGGSILFVGTKKQCQEAIKEQAARVGQPYVANRWLGGLLTNFSTINRRIRTLHELRERVADGSVDLLPNREAMKMKADLVKLETNLGGVSSMERLPHAVFVIDPRKEQIVVKEARKLHIPIVALVDTNCDPDEVDYIIPGNDDAIRSCSLIVRVFADAVQEGKQMLAEHEFRAAAEREKIDAEQRARAEAEGAVASGDAAAQPEAPAQERRPREGGGREGGQRGGRPGGDRGGQGAGRGPGGPGRGGPGGQSRGPGGPGRGPGGPGGPGRGGQGGPGGPGGRRGGPAERKPPQPAPIGRRAPDRRPKPEAVAEPPAVVDEAAAKAAAEQAAEAAATQPVTAEAPEAQAPEAPKAAEPQAEETPAKAEDAPVEVKAENAPAKAEEAPVEAAKAEKEEPPTEPAEPAAEASSEPEAETKE